MAEILVTGANAIAKGLVKYRHQMGKRIENALMHGGKFILDESRKVVPIDTGDLYESSFIRKEGADFQTVVVVGYTAPYAAYVHLQPWKEHGSAYNISHSAEIAAGTTHSRRLEERYDYLSGPILEKMPELKAVIQAAIDQDKIIGVDLTGETFGGFPPP